MTSGLSFQGTTLFEGLYGGFWGIIAGPIGIRLSKPNNLSRTQCLWKAYITLIFFTMMGSLAGLIMNIISISPYSGESMSRNVHSYALSCVQLTLIIGKDSNFYFLMKNIFSSFDRFVLGFLELRLFKMPAQSIVKTNNSRRTYRNSEQQ